MAKTGGGKNGGKQKFWRKCAKKMFDGSTAIRTGRNLKNAMNGTNHPGFLLPIHVWLFKSAGISTPVLDSSIIQKYNSNIAEDQSVVDAEIITSERNEIATI